MRRLALVLLVVLGLALAYLVVVLVRGHIQVRAEDSPLPGPQALEAALATQEGPVRVHFINTATQGLPAGQALSHPAFVFEWSDGRLFLLDAGMRPEEAVAFGKPMELLLDNGPTRPHGSVSAQLGKAASRVGGIAFTHLHSDHTDGMVALCAARPSDLAVFQTAPQAENRNHTTDMGHALILEAGCARFERMRSAPVSTIPGFPGLVAVAAGGHTPGSTVYLARVDGHRWIFSGDITNSRGELEDDVPKSLLYSVLIVPEDRDRLADLREWLRTLDAEPETTVVVSHDAIALETSGPPAWPGPR